MIKRHLFVFIALLPVLVLSGPAQAERRESGAADAMRKAQVMIRKLSMEKNELQAGNAKLDARVKELEDKTAKLKNGLEDQRNKLGKARASNTRLVGRIQSDVDKYKQLIEKYRQLRQTLAKAMGDNHLLVSAVQERDDWMSQCHAKNEKMYKANLELLDRYKNKTVAQVLKDKEPILGLGRVQLERTVQNYRFRLEDLAVTPFEPSASPLQPQASR